MKTFEDQEVISRKVITLVDVGVPNLLGHVRNGILKACEEVSGKKMERSKGDTWW